MKINMLEQSGHDKTGVLGTTTFKRVGVEDIIENYPTFSLSAVWGRDAAIVSPNHLTNLFSLDANSRRLPSLIYNGPERAVMIFFFC